MHKLLLGHECMTAQQCGWGGIKNGDLLQLAKDKFDLFITADQNLRYQQNLADRRIAILELSSNDLRSIRAAASLIQTTITLILSGEFRHLHIP